MAGDLQHPGYVLGTGRPAEVTLAPESLRRSAAIDEDGWFDVPEDVDADPIRDRLATVYDVEYDAEGAAHPIETDDDADAEPASGDADEEVDEDEADEYTRDELDELDLDALREVFDDLGGDRDAVDMRKPNEIVAAILRLQTENGGE